MITLFVTPVIHLWLEWFQEHVLDKVPFLRSAHMRHEDDPGHSPPRRATARFNPHQPRHSKRKRSSEKASAFARPMYVSSASYPDDGGPSSERVATTKFRMAERP